MPVAALQVGQEVLAEGADQTLMFERVLGFLHFMQEVSGRFYIVVHELGHLRATSEHVVFILNARGVRTDVLMKEVRVGDRVFAARAQGLAVAPSRVLAVRETESAKVAPAGMYAPLTASGSVVVDRTLASVYASAAMYRTGPHSAYHAVFFPCARILLRASGGDDDRLTCAS